VNPGTGGFEYFVQQAWRESPSSTNYLYFTHWIGSVVPNRWVDWVVHVKWSDVGDGDGLLEIWRDGNPDPVLRLSGRTDDYDDGTHHDWGNYMKFGIYKWPWAKTPGQGDKQREMYVDELRIADESGDRDAVSPRSQQGNS
jgi:hypothetical protein